MAIKSAKALGLKIAGIDIIRSSKGPMILEVNSSPGLEGIEGSTGINVAAEIIKFIERRNKKEKKKFSKNTIET
jgi:ribosomal protein S6--L-glutamate ligase